MSTQAKIAASLTAYATIWAAALIFGWDATVTMKILVAIGILYSLVVGPVVYRNR